MKECSDCGECLDDSLVRCPRDGSLLNVSLDGPRLIDRKYLLVRCLGRGGMGSVYLAQHVELQKMFALKLIRYSGLSDTAYHARFRIEAKALGKLQHPNIVQVSDYGIDPRSGGIPYLVMEYLVGKSLFHHIYKEGALKIQQAMPIIESIAGAIDYAHSCGILHRDLNLKNVFLVQDSSDKMEVKILDFGLARMLAEHLPEDDRVITEQPGPLTNQESLEAKTQTLIIDDKKKVDSSQESLPPLPLETYPIIEMDRLTRAGTLMGTPGYIAPELFQGCDSTKASDIYSFGVLIYEILVGYQPLQNIINLRQLPHSLPIPSLERPDVPRELDQAILAPLQTDPDMRPKKAADVVHRLQRAFAEYKYRIWRDKEVPRRLRLSGALTIVFILIYWLFQALPVVKSFESLVVDFRVAMLPLQPPDDRIVLVSFDNASRQADPTPLEEKADEMGILLQSVLDAGARGVAIDLLVPRNWSQSKSFARLIIKNQGKLVLSSYIKKDDSVVGMECVEELSMDAPGSKERAEAPFGFLNMQPDNDGRIRHMQIGLYSQEGRRMSSMPATAFRVFAGKNFSSGQVEKRPWIEYSIDWKKFQRISLKDLSSYLSTKPNFFTNKIVLVGA